MTSFHRGDWLALAQAIGGMLAVAAAALVPFIHGLFVERRKRKAHYRITIAICDRVIGLFNELLDALRSDAELLGFQEYAPDAEWAEFGVILTSFPLWDVADEHVAVQIGYLRNTIERGKRLERACKKLESTAAEPWASEIEESIKGCIVTIEIARDVLRDNA